MTIAITRDRCVRRAMEAAEAALARNPAATPTLSDLAEASGVSPRTLQRRFACVLGRSPHSIVRQLRLAAARQSLRTGQATSVIDAALRHGFEHPGHFAAAYARAFGEAPSATLRTTRHERPASPAAPPSLQIVLRPLRAATPDDAARALGSG
ncbi:helix-turn-helix transcriptional regulator [Sabulicella glaciei]|uniref:Helix-turn-helix transcriptional regulator n=1 Tax=Sabulicella glaciei TaxID=2984948 RepID=A0ABT3P234_9PROT|nr:helix-turn-helix transcriptional regulator [Roseococcus sp. MDT2-1-1]MCW8088466.1 helix-turn-helix transcriptional regulator [Roseococcus sp. MDT2-1-1]